MAAITAIHTALGHLGFTGVAQTFITDAQGLDTLEEFHILTDSKVESLIKVIRHPGGGPLPTQPQEQHLTLAFRILALLFP